MSPKGIINTRCLPGNGAGPQEERLILGSEGVFGVITEAWLRVQDIPQHRPYFLQQNSPLTLAMLNTAKAEVVPKGIMNPGTLL